MILHLLHALPGCLVIGLMAYAAVRAWPRETKPGAPASKRQKLSAANRWRW